MAFDASSELYILPFKPPNENKFHNLCKNGSVVGSSSDGSNDLLEIRITEIPQDLDGDTMLHTRDITGATNDFGAVMKHQEIDFESLNQILCKDVVFMSSSNSDDSKLITGSDVTMFSEVKSLSSVPVIMFSKEDSDQDIVSHSELLPEDNCHFSSEKDDDYIVFKDDTDVLGAVEVLGVDSMESIDAVWIPDQEQLPEVGLDICKTVGPQPQSSHLVPVKLENNVVFIDAAPSNSSVKNQTHSRRKSESNSQDRPSVISIAVPIAEKNNLNPQQTSARSKRIAHNDAACHQPAVVQVASNQIPAQPTLSAHSRSVLKTSVTKKGPKFAAVKSKLSARQVLKEDHFISLINQSSKQINQNVQLMRRTGSKVVKGNSSKSQSLAVVAISSDKSKDLTEIVVRTAKGDQIFKGKTSELINATPNLWCTSPGKKSQDTADNNSLEEEELLDYQPVTDALEKLGVPALSWVQNKPEDPKMWYCPEKSCKKLFPILNQLKVHILGHYGVRPYKCDFPNCQWAFYTHFKLKRHKETHLQRKDFKCSVPECGRSFTTIYNLKTHQKLHKRPAEMMCHVKGCNEFFQTRRSLEFHMKEHGSDHAPYVCPYASCQKRYYTVNSVNSHIRSHQHKDDEIRCQWSGCTKVFTKPCRLKAHMRTHTGDKPYLCTHPDCTWAFTSSSKLRRHQFKHTNVRKFQCPIDGCGKMFMRSEHLKEHALTHSSERTFQCPHPNCNMKFSAKSSLYVHSKKHRAKVHAVPTDTLADAITSIPVKVIQSTGKICMDTNVCTLPELTMEDQVVIQSLPIENTVQSDIPEGTQTLDLIPLLSEDEALVAELVGMEHVSFQHNEIAPQRPEEASSIPSQVIENSSNVLNILPSYIDDPGNPSNMSQVICTQESEGNFTDAVEQDEEIGQVLNPESARSSITIHSWTKFKKVRQSQAIRTTRQPKRPALQARKTPLRLHTVDSDASPLSGTKQITQGGLSNGRAPLDVVLGAGYLGSGHQDSIAHLLLPDDLSTSNDLYSSEDGILSMDTSFAPSTINLRDLE